MHRGRSAAGLVAVVCLLVAVALVAVGPVAGGGGGGVADGGSVGGDVDVADGGGSGVGVAGDDPTTRSFAAGPAEGGVGDAPSAVPSVASDGDTIVLTNELRLTDEPGRIGVRTVAEVPDRVTELTLVLRSVDGDAAVEADGFERTGGSDGTQEWSWDGETASPSIDYAMDANATVDPEGPLAGEGSYRFVGVEDWAITRTPRVGLRWTQTGPGEVTVDRGATVDGEGVAGSAMAYIGPYEERVAEESGQRFRLIVPEAAAPAARTEDVFGSLTFAAESLAVGARDDEVLAVTAPTDGVAWAVRGLQTGEADFWVRDRESATGADDVWAHEYVHTRQAFRTEPSGAWITEATATYYAALFAVDRGVAGFDAFERVLARGERDPESSAVLADRSTWREHPDYTKGALVAGEIDRRIRVATDGRSSLATVLRELNAAGDPVTNEDVLDAVESAAADGADAETAAAIRADAERYTTTEAVPETWDRDAHEAAFGETPARVRYSLSPVNVRATGEYRDSIVEDDPVRLVAGETLALTVDVSNTGGATGSYELSMRVDGDEVDAAAGEVGAGNETTATLTHAFEGTGEHEVRVAGETLRVVVSEPADPSVVDVTAIPVEVDAGDAVTVSAHLANEAPVPAEGDLDVRVNGETVATEPVRIDVGNETLVERDVVLDDPGEARITVSIGGSEASSTVTVEGDPFAGDATGGDTGDPGDASDDGVPGFGVAAAALAVAVASLLARRS